MQQAYDRSFIVSSNLKAFLSSALGEFSKELATNPLPLLENVRNEIAGIGKKNLMPITDVKITVLSELDATIQLLTTHKETIPALRYYIQECEDAKKRCPENSNAMIHLLEPIFQKVVAFFLCDRSADHSKLLAALVELDNEGKIIKYIFAPSLYAWHEEGQIWERNNTSSIEQSLGRLIYLYSLYDLKARQNMIQHFAQENNQLAVHYICLDAEKLDAALEGRTQKDAIALGFDIEEIKVNMSRVWDFIKPQLLSDEVKQAIPEDTHQEDTYDGTTGILKIMGIPIQFQRHGLRGQIMENLFPGSKPVPIVFDVLYDEIINQQLCAIWSKFGNKKWDGLSQDQRAAVKKDIYDACGGINDRIEKKTQSKVKNYVKVDNLTLSI